MLTTFAFIPYRAVDPQALAGGWVPLVWTPITHAFLHAGWEHVLLNSVWCAVFATPVARRYGAGTMLLIFGLGAAAGAAAFAATTLPDFSLLIGASGGVAALTGAAVRFMFHGRIAGLSELALHPRARMFVIVWGVANAAVPLLSVVLGEGLQIAWQAHLGGFFFGLLAIAPLARRSAR